MLTTNFSSDIQGAFSNMRSKNNNNVDDDDDDDWNSYIWNFSMYDDDDDDDDDYDGYII